MISCQHCDSENVRVQGQAILSAPGELMYQFSKSNLRRKDVYLMGVNWETFDVICSDCNKVTGAYGNYVSRMEIENKNLTASIESKDEIIRSQRKAYSLLHTKAGVFKDTIRARESTIAERNREIERLLSQINELETDSE